MKRIASTFLFAVVSIGLGSSLMGCSYNRYEGRRRYWDHDRYYYRDDHYRDYRYERGPERWHDHDHDRDWR